MFRSRVCVVWAVLAVVFRLSSAKSKPNSPFCEDTFVSRCPADAVPGGSCSVENITAGCSHLNLNGAGAVGNDVSLLNFNLEAYQYLGQIRSFPSINVSLSNISFKSLILRLTVGNENMTICRKFIIDNPVKSALESTILFWDCPGIKYRFTEFNMSLEYQATNGFLVDYRKYFFRLPKNGNIDPETTKLEDWEIFIYREDLPHQINFFWSKLPNKFETSKYRVTLHEVDSQTVVSRQNVSNQTSISFSELPKSFTLYNISVEPWIEDKQKWGKASFSEVFYTKTPPGLMSGLALTVAGLFFLMFSFCCVMCSIKISLYKINAKPKKSIIVYEPSSIKHLEVLEKLVIFLKSVLDIVLYGETDIGKMNAVDWWSKELDSSDLIIIVSNPEKKSYEDICAASIRAPVFIQGVVERCLQGAITTSSSPKKYVRILLPYCKKSDFYDFVKSISRCHKIIEDRFSMLQDILGQNNFFVPRFAFWYLYSSIFQSESWRELKKAIENYNNQTDSRSNLKVEVCDDQSLHSLIKEFSSSEDEADPDEEERMCQAHITLHNIMDDNSSDSESPNCPERVKLSAHDAHLEMKPVMVSVKDYHVEPLSLSDSSSNHVEDSARIEEGMRRIDDFLL